MGGLYPRVKTWGATDTVIGSDLNAEFDQVLNYFMTQYMDDYSATVSQMRTQTDPGESATESQATSLAGELERIRFVLTEIKGTTYWYQSATSSIAQLVSAIGTNLLANRISSGRMSSNSSQPIFLVPNGSAATITLKGATTPFVYSINGTQYTISTDVSVTGLTTAPSSNNTATLNDSTLAAAFSKIVGENGTQITVNAMGSEITGLNGKVAAFKTAGGEYFLARVESSTALTKAFRGYFFNSSDAIVPRGTLTNGNAVTLMKLTWIYATTAGALAVSYTNPRYSATAPTSPAIGDYWFDMTSTVNYWKSYNGTTWSSAGATLIGVCIQDASNCIGARSFDFFHNYADTNTCELIYESATEVRARYRGAKVSVYGTELTWDQDWLRWNTSTDFDSGVAEAASTYYYAYVKESGAVVLSDVAPYDMRTNRRGYYHPAETWRCVGYVRNNSSSDFGTNDVESFFATNEWRSVIPYTAAVANYPLPYNITPKIRTFTFDASGGAVNQVIPPAAQTKGEILRFIRTDNTPANALTLTAFGADTINGAASYAMYTQYESVSMVSTGSIYYVVDHWAKTNWVAYTPTITGCGTAVSLTFIWRREGPDLEVNGTYTCGTVAASTVSFTLPTGVTLSGNIPLANTTAQSGPIWGKYAQNTSSGFAGHVVSATGTSTLLVYFGGIPGSSAYLVPATGSGALASSDVVSLWFKIPATGWLP